MAQIGLVLGALALSALAIPANAASLDTLRDKARADLTERQMSVFVVSPAGVTTLAGGRAPSGFEADELRKSFGVKDDAFEIVLIGKDGGEKFRAAEPVDAGKLTGLVDTMPMRKNETR